MHLSEAEWKVMGAVWRKSPATARQVMALLPKKTRWAYTTVKTLLSRLVDKGALSERKEGNTSVYEPLVALGEARRSALSDLADRAFDGALGPMMHFLLTDSKMGERERKQLRDLLEREKP